jgi:hypothetical protein
MTHWKQSGARPRPTDVNRLLPVFLVVAMAAVLAGCGEESGSADSPRVVENPPPIELDGDPPYGPGIERGESYDYVLYTHCGIEWAPIDGVWWRIDPLGVANASPPDGWRAVPLGRFLALDRAWSHRPPRVVETCGCRLIDRPISIANSGANHDRGCETTLRASCRAGSTFVASLSDLRR